MGSCCEARGAEQVIAPHQSGLVENLEINNELPVKISRGASKQVDNSDKQNMGKSKGKSKGVLADLRDSQAAKRKPRVSENQSLVPTKIDISGFQATKVLEQMFSSITYNESSLKKLAQQTVKVMIQLQTQQETKEEKQLVNSMFTTTVQKSLIQNKINSQYLVDLAGSVSGKTLKEASLSRIYHTSTNIIKKGKAISRNYINPYSIRCFESNSYSYHEKESLQKIIKLQHIAKYVDSYAQRIQFEIGSIKKESEQFISFMNECMKKHQNSLTQLKYDFDMKEVELVAQISREACNFIEDGIYVLIVYLIKSCLKSQANGTGIDQIQKMKSFVIGAVSQKYPPGQKLSEDDSDVEKKLQKLVKKDKDYKPIKYKYLLNQSNKSQQLEKIIVSVAQIASNKKHFLQQLIQDCCLTRCIGYKAGLKYYPNNPNPKAMMRIQQKMLFKNVKSGDKKGKTIAQRLDSQQQQYKQKLKQILAKKDEIDFTISDMVRGKCIFLNIQDILFTIQDIIRFCNSRSNHFKIIQIQSRFNKQIPISDVTLKIALDDEVIAELQLTLQTNAAAYLFAHKVYQLSRSIIFSKIKITHNYYQEFNKDFNQLISRSFQLNKPGKQQVVKASQSIVYSYFQIVDESVRSYGKVLQEILSQKTKKIKLTTTNLVCLNSELQGLINNLVVRRIGLGRKQLGKYMMKTLKSSYGDQIKAVALTYFLKLFELQKEMPSMIQFLQKFDSLKLAQPQKFMQEYILEFYGITGIGTYAPKLANLYYYFNNINTIIIVWNDQSNKANIKSFGSFLDITRGVYNETQLNFMTQLADCYLIKEQYQDFLLINEWIKKIIDSLPQTRKIKQIRANFSFNEAYHLVINQRVEQAKQIFIELIKIFLKLQDSRKTILASIMLAYCHLELGDLQSYKQHYTKSLKNAEGQGIILTQYTYGQLQIMIGNQLLKSAKSVEQKIKIISQHWKQEIILNQVKIQNIFKYFSKLIDSSKVEDEFSAQFVEVKNITEIILPKNNINVYECKYLSFTNYPNLLIVNLESNQIRSEGCASLIKAKWKNLSHLNLSYNKIGQEGCEFLSQSQWPRLKKLQLNGCQIYDQAYKCILKGDWPQLQQISFNQNFISLKNDQEECCDDNQNQEDQEYASNQDQYQYQDQDEQCQASDKNQSEEKDQQQNQSQKISLVNLGEGQQINGQPNGSNKNCQTGDQQQKSNKNSSKKSVQQQNQIENKSQYNDQQLVLSNWKELKSISFEKNDIQSLKYLFHKQPWSNLQSLNLANNQGLKSKDYKYLLKLKWLKLKHIYFGKISTDSEGLSLLKKSQWQCLQTIALKNCRLNSECIKVLVQIKWPNLLNIDLNSDASERYCYRTYQNKYRNRIEDEGCYFLKQARWLGQLQSIKMSRSELTDKTCLTLRELNMPNLMTLELAGNQISQVGVKNLTEANWPLMKKIILRNNPCNMDRAIVSIRSAKWPLLQQLDIAECKRNPSQQFWSELIKCNWPNLLILTIQQYRMTLQTFEDLTKANWSNLQKLKIAHNENPRGQEMEKVRFILKKRFPKILVQAYYQVTEKLIYV